MNWRQGLFRLWWVASAFWVPLAIWIEWPCMIYGECRGGGGAPSLVGVAAFIFGIPPLSLLAGLGIDWAMRGFRSKSN